MIDSKKGKSLMGEIYFKITFEEISRMAGGILVLADSSPQDFVTRFASISDLTENSIGYCDGNYKVPESRPKKSLLLVEDSSIPIDLPGSYVVVENARLAFARIISDIYRNFNRRVPGIHPHAIVVEGATVSDTAIISAGVVVDKGAVIGSGVVVASCAYIGEGCIIGDDSVIQPGARILAKSIIGEACVIGSNAVIGADGFGWVPSKDEFEYMPHLGRAVLGDCVSVGAGSIICRGTLEDTKIDSGVKLDGMVMIAHNVTIGTNTLVCGGSAVAGSAKIGANCMIGGLVGIIGHIEIVNRVMIGAGSMIGSSITTAGLYCARFPTFTVRQWARIGVFLKRSVEKSGKIK